MKQLYYFQLGRTPDLSLAELRSVFATRAWSWSLKQQAEHIALVESQDVDFESLNYQLGGTVKMGSIVEQLPLSSISDLPMLFSFEVLMHEFFTADATKVEFGVSIYSCGGKQEDVQKLFNLHEEVTQTIKRNLEDNSVKAHFPQMREKTLSSASVDKNRLLKKGAEIVLIVTQDSLLVSKTSAVQLFESFSRRDFGRPTRDMISGVMPPKIARMMLNIGGVSATTAVLDPFCGSGTVLQEALSLGIKNVIGTDISDKAVRDSKENIRWYQERIDQDSKAAKVRIEKADVTKLSGILKAESIDVIVTEPFLGPTLKHKAHPEQARRTLQELSHLYLSAFEEFAKILKPAGAVVFIFPAFSGHKTVYIEILNQIKKLGFKQEILSGSPRGTITVGTNRDYVLREIGKFVKK